MRTSSYIIDVPLPGQEKSLLFHGYSGAVDLVSTRVARLLAAPHSSGRAPVKGLSQGTVSLLLARGYLTEKTEAQEQAYVVELGRRVHGVMRRVASPGFLVVPSYDCNLQCPYCYERGLRTRGATWLAERMSSEMTEAALEAMDRISGPSPRSRSLTFYGGEPLQRSNDKTIRRLHDLACKRGFQRFSAITNAVELDHYRDLLGQDRGISFLQVTLDGPPSLHNERRFLKDGSGTFERIVQNIELAMKEGVRVSVRVNVDHGNAHGVSWLRAFFQNKGWNGNTLFRAYCSPVHGSIRDKPRANTFRSHLEMDEAVQEKKNVQANFGDASALQTDALTHAVRNRILAHLQRKQDLPTWKTAFCGSNMAMYLFDPFGDIYPCWEVIGHREHRIGTYGPGFLQLDAGAVEHWHDRSVVQIPACRSCPYLFFCGGGCGAFAYRETRRLDQPYCLDFPDHFQKAAPLAYREWNDAGINRKPCP